MIMNDSDTRGPCWANSDHNHKHHNCSHHNNNNNVQDSRFVDQQIASITVQPEYKTNKCPPEDSVSYTEPCTEETCGVGSCRPRWLQRFANPPSYVFLLALIQITEMTFYTYFHSIISTLERQLGVRAKTIGYIMAGNEISQVCCALFLAHFGSQGHRPRWLAAAMLLVALANVLLASPLLMFHNSSPHGSPTDTGYPDSPSSSLCPLDGSGLPLDPWSLNGTSTRLVNASASSQSSIISSGSPATLLLFCGLFVAGMGFSLLTTLTVSYLDDNVSKAKSPMYLGIVTGLKVFGPTLGSLLGGFCLSFYLTLRDDHKLSPRSPAWIGAWWLGFVVLAAVYFLGAFFISLFPRRLPNRKLGSQVSDQYRRNLQAVILAGPEKDKPVPVPHIPIKSTTHIAKKYVLKLRDFVSALKRVFQNKLLLCHSASRCFQLFGVNGFTTFQPKYLEAHFQQTASGASYFSGLSGNFMRAIGIVAVGLILRKWKPRTCVVTSWNILLDVIFISGLIGMMSITCPTIQISGVNLATDIHHDVHPNVSCSMDCSCSRVPFQPVCLAGKNHYSPCHAGCTGYQGEESYHKVYTNCTCVEHPEIAIEDPLDVLSEEEEENNKNSLLTALSGYCEDGSCFSSFTAYLIVLGLTKTIFATKKIGRLLITLRCVEERDKSLALAFSAVMESLFAYLPCRIVYGALVDAACVLRGTGKGGSSGACWLYDADTLRYSIHGITIVSFVIGAVLDAVVLWQCRHLRLFDEPSTSTTVSTHKSTTHSTEDLTTNSVSPLPSSGDDVVQSNASIQPVQKY